MPGYFVDRDAGRIPTRRIRRDHCRSSDRRHLGDHEQADLAPGKIEHFEEGRQIGDRWVSCSVGASPSACAKTTKVGISPAGADFSQGERAPAEVRAGREHLNETAKHRGPRIPLILRDDDDGACDSAEAALALPARRGIHNYKAAKPERAGRTSISSTPALRSRRAIASGCGVRQQIGAARKELQPTLPKTAEHSNAGPVARMPMITGAFE